MSSSEEIIQMIEEYQPVSSAFLAEKLNKTTRRMTRLLRKLTRQGKIIMLPDLKDMRFYLYLIKIK